MVNKIFVMFSLLLCMGLVSSSAAGCGGFFERPCVDKLDGLVTETVNPGTSYFAEMLFTESNQQRLIAASTMPKPTSSLERQNLIRRYEFLNDQNKQFYVYLVSYGKVMAFYTAQGKISSTNSRLTQEEQIVPTRNMKGDYNSRSYNDVDYIAVGSPQLDGSYGTNGDGIFFFTTEGAYVEWNGEYMVSDFPLKLSTPPTLVQTLE